MSATFDQAVIQAAEGVIAAAREAGAMVTTAESCTAGLVAGALTAVPGSSAVVDGGFVTYSNHAKMLLGVPEALLTAHGAVSREVAHALAMAAAVRCGVAPVAAVSVTGVAGPGGGSAAKPVGLVHVAAAFGRETRHREARFGDLGRDGVRRASVIAALHLLTEVLHTRTGGADGSAA